MISCTVDSATLIDALRLHPSALAALANYSNIGISHVAFGELLVGAFKLSDSTEIAKISRMIAGMTLLLGDGRTSALYARIRADLEKDGRMIPQNDIWIAASAIQADVPLISRDQHFRRISQLKLIEY